MMINLTSQYAVDVAQLATKTFTAGVVEHDPVDGDHVVPGELRRFLARLRLLHGIPFSYLVPDADLLPVESIRFFYVDRAWTDALVQGVLSVGTITTSDRAELEAVHRPIRDDVDVAERTIRTPDDEELLNGAGGTITGFLLRSRAVSGWPGLHVRAYSRDVVKDDALTTEAESNPERMKLLRMERLAPAVLLVLIDGVPEVVHIEEPRQGIQFGARLDPEDPPASRQGKVHMRDAATGDLVAPVDDFTAANSIPVPFRGGAPGVIDLAEMKRRMEKKPVPNIDGTLDPHEFAMQMLRFPFRQVFGDPKDLENQKFYSLDKFKVTLSMTTWKATLATDLGSLGGGS